MTQPNGFFPPKTPGNQFLPGELRVTSVETGSRESGLDP